MQVLPEGSVCQAEALGYQVGSTEEALNILTAPQLGRVSVRSEN